MSMNKYPVIYGISAFLYVVVVVTVMNLGSALMSEPNNFAASIAIISLLTLSVAIMGYLFFFQPFSLYFSEKKKESVGFFLQTVFTFGFLTLVMLILMFAGVFS